MMESMNINYKTNGSTTTSTRSKAKTFVPKYRKGYSIKEIKEQLIQFFSFPP